MSGHSKWSTIKRKKGANDEAKGKIFAKISKEIMVSVREGGGDPAANTRLRAAIIKGHSENMPNANIERAIKKALGDNDDTVYEEIIYEGYAPGGIAVLVQCLTDNKNRTAPEVRHTFSKYGGSLGAVGCVSYMFTRKGIILVAPENKQNKTREDELFEILLNQEVEDTQQSDNGYELMTSPENFNATVQALEDSKFTVTHAEITLIADTYISTDDETAESALLLFEKLEDLDDVQAVVHNLEER